MEKLIEILEDLNPEVDYNTCTNLIDGHYLDSLAILSLVAEIEEEFDELAEETNELIVSLKEVNKENAIALHQ